MDRAGGGAFFLIPWASPGPAFPEDQAEAISRSLSLVEAVGEGAWSVPVGPAFLAMWEQAEAQGWDPMEPGSPFATLWEGEDLSERGRCLVALSAARALSGAYDLEWAVCKGHEDLVEACERPLDPYGDYPYPWALEWGEQGQVVAPPQYETTLRLQSSTPVNSLDLHPDGEQATHLWIEPGGALLSYGSVHGSHRASVRVHGGAFQAPTFIGNLDIDSGEAFLGEVSSMEVQIRGGSLTLVQELDAGTYPWALHVDGPLHLHPDGTLILSGDTASISSYGAVTLEGSLVVGDWEGRDPKEKERLLSAIALYADLDTLDTSVPEGTHLEIERDRLYLAPDYTPGCSTLGGRPWSVLLLPLLVGVRRRRRAGQ